MCRSRLSHMLGDEDAGEDISPVTQEAIANVRCGSSSLWRRRQCAQALQRDDVHVDICKPNSISRSQDQIPQQVLAARLVRQIDDEAGQDADTPTTCSDATYDLLEVLGTGSAGTVRRAIRRSDGKSVALKTMRCRDAEVISAAQQEFELLQRLPPHPHIIQAMGFHGYSAFDEAVLVLEYFDGTDLNQAVASSSQRHLSESSSRTLSVALVLAIAHLHAYRILHRDVKPENVLVSRDLTGLKLIDFNVARHLDDGMSLTPTGTEMYKPPEALLGDAPSQPSDIWAVGVCVFLMLTGRLPQRRSKEQSRWELIETSQEPVSLNGVRWRHVSDACKFVVRSCLRLSPEDRATAFDLLASEWIGYVGSDALEPSV